MRSYNSKGLLPDFLRGVGKSGERADHTGRSIPFIDQLRRHSAGQQPCDGRNHVSFETVALAASSVVVHDTDAAVVGIQDATKVRRKHELRGPIGRCSYRDVGKVMCLQIGRPAPERCGIARLPAECDDFLCRPVVLFEHVLADMMHIAEEQLRGAQHGLQTDRELRLMNRRNCFQSPARTMEPFGAIVHNGRMAWATSIWVASSM